MTEYLTKKKKELQAKGQKPYGARFPKTTRQKTAEVSSEDEDASEYENTAEKQGLVMDKFFPEDYDDEELRQIRRRNPIPRNTWIVKPGENSNRGVGINVAHEMSEIRYLVTSSAGRGGAKQVDNTVII